MRADNRGMHKRRRGQSGWQSQRQEDQEMGRNGNSAVRLKAHITPQVSWGTYPEIVRLVEKYGSYET